MSNKKILLLAIILGLVTALSINLYLNQLKKEMQNVESVKVIVAAQNIPARTEVKSTMLIEKELPKELMHKNAISSSNDILGKITTTEILAGEQILTGRVIAANDMSKGLGYGVPKGMRAVSVAVDDVSGVSGLVKPGDRVDVLVTMDIESSTPDGRTNKLTFSKAILQDIGVLAVGKSLTDLIENKDDKQVTETKTVTMSVYVEDAVTLTLASERGKIRLALRSPVDKTIKPIPRVEPLNIYLKQ